MSDLFNSPSDLLPMTKARSVDINTLDRAIGAAFDKLPNEMNIKGGTINFAVDSGTDDNAYIVALPFNLAALFDGLEVVMSSSRPNKGPATINVNAIGAIPIIRVDGLPARAGDIPPVSFMSLRYSASKNAFVMPSLGGSDVLQTALDRAATAQDRIATGQDRAQTGLDRAAAAASAAQAASGAAFPDNKPIVRGAVDPTKTMLINVSGLASGVQREVTPPARNGQLLTKEELASTSFNRIEMIEVSSNFVAKVTGPHRLTLVGPAGSGANVIANETVSASCTAAATGGAAGGIAIKQLNLVQGDSLAIVIGAPGTNRNNSGVGPSNLAGLAGGQSRVTGPGIALIANGGGGGRGTLSATEVAAVALGATGGTASGGDLNFTGSDSGVATATSTFISSTRTFSAAATGGAGVPYYGQRWPSGNATVTGGAAASGGASPSGSSGAVNVTTAYVGAGGGAGTGNSPDIIAGAGARGPGLPTFSLAGFSLTGSGGLGASTPGINADGSGNGGAGGAYAFRPASSLDTSGVSGIGGLFAGSGAVAIGRCPTATNVVSVGAPGRGAGSGGLAVVTSTGSTVTAIVPPGGTSFCLIEYFQEQA